MTEELPQSVIDAASEAYCTRCKEQIVGSKSVTGTMMFNYYVPALGVRARGILCGACGIAFREFASPELADNPAYRAVVAELRSRW